MANAFPYSFNEKHYHTYNHYLKTTYNQKIAKVILDAGFTCPNRDGKKGYGGCIFCSSVGSGDTNRHLKEDLLNQYEQNKKLTSSKWPNAYYIPYFQSFSNTYGPLNKIKEMVEPFLDKDEVKEIAIATRCDCLEDETISYLDSICSKKQIWLELGLQSSNDETAKYINRGHTFKEFKDAVNKLKNTNIKICVHIINGLFVEQKEDMLKTVKELNALNIDAIKIHMLTVLKNTALEKSYNPSINHLLSKDEYVDIVVNQIRLLKPEIIIERVTSDPLKKDLIDPDWVLNKKVILNSIDKIMRENNYYQGDLLDKK